MKYIICVLLLLPLGMFSQEKEQEEPVKIKLTEKQILRKGNDLFKQQKYVDAEVKYKKALKENPYYEKAGYNLGNAVYEQKRYKDALPQYELVAKSTGDLTTKKKSFHNIGNVMMKEKQYDKAVAAYKNSLLLDPKDEETRYNLALAQKLLKDQQQQQDQNKDQNKDQNEDQEKDQNQDQNSENKDQNQDQGEDDKKEEDENKGDNENDQQDQQNEGDKKEEQKQPEPNQLSQQQIEQLLEAMNNEENKTQQKVNAEKAKGKKVKQEKDW